ncbi:hypothetical protein ACFQ2B_00530 [Streptomyces stramineus]
MTLAEHEDIHLRAAQLLYSDGHPAERAAAQLLAVTSGTNGWTVEVLRSAATAARRRGAPRKPPATCAAPCSAVPRPVPTGRPCCSTWPHRSATSTRRPPCASSPRRSSCSPHPRGARSPPPVPRPPCSAAAPRRSSTPSPRQPPNWATRTGSPASNARPPCGWRPGCAMSLWPGPAKSPAAPSGYGLSAVRPRWAPPQNANWPPCSCTAPPSPSGCPPRRPPSRPTASSSTNPRPPTTSIPG